MDNIYKKIENELNDLSKEEREEIIRKLRDDIDVLDKQIVHLLSKRTLNSVLIGRVKRSLHLATYNPQREKEISERIGSFVEEPLSKEALLRIYERILDESRAIQREESDRGNVFNLSANKMKVGFKNLLSKKEFIFITAFFFVVLAFLYFTFFTPNYYTIPAPVKLEVTRGEPFSKIADDLYMKGVIPSKTNFRIAAFIYGAEKKIKAARYYIPNGLSYLDLIDFLLTSHADLLKTVTIQNGASLQWVASKLKDDLYIDSSEVVNLCKDKGFLDTLGLKSHSLLGYLIPKRYSFFERSSPRNILKTMYNSFENFMDDSLKERAQKLGYSIPKIITLASIVEGETNRKDEMPIIASVYYNRLKKRMKLQADPTIEFIKQGAWGRLDYADLKIKSPYNTYENYGLPPGPINNPGKAAILAALYPAKTNYLYFVADGNGGHIFSSTFRQHQKNAEKYRKWLNSLKRR
jgi:UPF0755 protein